MRPILKETDAGAENDVEIWTPHKQQLAQLSKQCLKPGFASREASCRVVSVRLLFMFCNPTLADLPP
eukprot:174126-Pelagomonas_calceolata.AAC.2